MTERRTGREVDGIRFALKLTCSEESERVSELKRISGSGNLLNDQLASESEGIKDAIHGFDDASVCLLNRVNQRGQADWSGGRAISRTSACHPTSST